MADQYEKLRSIPLRAVLIHFGLTEFKKRRGKDEWTMACPIHKAENNKTSFSFTDTKFHCFSCGAKGTGAIDLLIKLKGIRFREATTILEGIIPNLPEEYTPVTENKPFNGNYEKYYQPSEWLEKRGIPQDILDLYGVGQYHNPNRQSAYSGKVMLPIYRLDGVKVGYLARSIDGEPKYTLPKGFLKQQELWGAYQISEVLASRGLARLPLGFVVESPFCVMKFRSLGYYAVSPFGFALSSFQSDIVSQLFERVLYIPDRDKQGQMDVRPLAQHCWVKSPELPDGLNDPEHLTEEQIQDLVR